MPDPLYKVDWIQLVASLASSSQAQLREECLPKNEGERREALLAFADIHHRLGKQAKCDVCRAPVRALMQTVGLDDEGQTWSYACLCRRCLEAEKAYCRRVTSYVAGVVFEDFENRRGLVARSRPASDKVAA